MVLVDPNQLVWYQTFVFLFLLMWQHHSFLENQKTNKFQDIKPPNYIENNNHDAEDDDCQFKHW